MWGLYEQVRNKYQWHSVRHKIFFEILSILNPNGTATITQISFDNFFWQAQWHSDYCTDLFWQYFLTFFDTLNGTDWHSMCHIVFWCFLLKALVSQIQMAQRQLHWLLATNFFDNHVCGIVWQCLPQRPNKATETRFDEEDLYRKFYEILMHKAKAKMIHELLPDMKKVIKILFLWVHRLITKAQRMQMNMQKQQSTSKYCAQQQNWYVNYCRIYPNMIKVKILRDSAGTHAMIRLLPERYNLNRPHPTTSRFEMVRCKGLKWSPKVFRILVEAVP